MDCQPPWSLPRQGALYHGGKTRGKTLRRGPANSDCTARTGGFDWGLAEQNTVLCYRNPVGGAVRKLEYEMLATEEASTHLDSASAQSA